MGAVAQVHGDVKVVHGFPVYLDRDPQAESFEHFNDLFRKWSAAGPGVSFNCRMLSPSSLYKPALFLPSIGSSWSKVKALFTHFSAVVRPHRDVESTIIILHPGLVMVEQQRPSRVHGDINVVDTCMLTSIR